jgi:hypothetical protein
MSDPVGADVPRVRCDAHVDVDSTPARGDVGDDAGSKTVAVDCQRCRSRLEVAVPLALLAEGAATVRCGACGVHLKVDFPTTLCDPVPQARTPPPLPQPRKNQAAQPSSSASLPLSNVGAFGSFLDPAVCVAMGASRAVTDPQLRKAAEEFWRSCDGTAHVADPLVTYSNDLTPERPAKKPKRERKPRDPSPYNVFIREEIPRLKAENPTMTHRDAFKTAARNWAGSSLNMRSAAYVMPAPVLADAGGGGGGRHGFESGASVESNAAARAAILQKLKPHLLRGRVKDAKAEAAAKEKEDEEVRRSDTAFEPDYLVSGSALVEGEQRTGGPVRPKTSWSSYRSTHELFEPID